MKPNVALSVVAVILVVLALPILLVKMGGQTKQAGGASKLRQGYDRIQSEGRPRTFEELDARYERPTDNVADLYVQAFDAYIELSPELRAKLPLDRESGAGLPPRGQPLPEATRMAIQERVRMNGRSIALLHKAAVRPQCRYPIDLLKGPAVEIPDLAILTVGGLYNAYYF